MSEALFLFDKFLRIDPTPAKYTESSFDALNRLSWNSATAIRDTLEQLFSKYPDNHKKELRARFRNSSVSDHKGALFELILYSLFTKMSYDVKINPQTSSGTPDFFIESKQKERFFLEATIANPKTFKDSPSENVVLDEINTLECQDYWLSLHTRGTLNGIPPLKQIKREIQNWIDQLEYDQVKVDINNSKKCPTYVVKYLDWTLTIEAFPTGQQFRTKPHRPIGVGPTHAGFVNSAKPIINAVHEKAKKYKSIDAPLVIAVNSLELLGADRIDILEALFGYESDTDRPNVARIIPKSCIHETNHIWNSNKNTGVSALLIFDALSESSLASNKYCIYENPWTSHPVPNALRCLPHALVEGEYLFWHEGDTLGKILGLSSDWPGP